MDTLAITRNELINLLQATEFEHLTQREQNRLGDYLRQILTTLEDAANPERSRRNTRKMR